MTDRTFADTGRELAVTYLRDGQLVGPDSPFIKFQQRLRLYWPYPKTRTFS